MANLAHRVLVESVEEVTHDVRAYTCTRPDGYGFRPGQATEVALDLDGWRDEARPFTFTSLPDDDHLELTVKAYPSHHGVTEQLAEVAPGDALLLDEPWGAIEDRGPGTFVAGGAGVTPFLAILRQRAATGALAGCHLVASHTTEADIIARAELEAMADLRVTWLVTDDPDSPFAADRLDGRSLGRLLEDPAQPFYVCGPPAMVDDVVDALGWLGIPDGSIVTEDLG